MRHLTEAVTWPFLIMALVGALAALVSGCAPASEEAGSTLVETVTAVAAAWPTTAPVDTVAPSTATAAAPADPDRPATRAAPAATPIPPMATAAALALTPGPPVGTLPPAAGPGPLAPAATGVPPAAGPPSPPATSAPATTAAGSLTVSYRLDPWLISGTYGGGFWVSPPVFGPVTQGGPTFALDTRAQGTNAQGQPVAISPEWVPSDPEMVAASPSKGDQVVMTVLCAGESRLRVTSGGVFKELAIKAAIQGNALLVEITQK